MFEKLLAHRDHIPPHRIWAIFNDPVVYLQPGEFRHLLTCEDCEQFGRVCMRADSFGDALGIWLAENDIDKAG